MTAIVLLDLHLRADQFQDDASLGALAASLEEAGHEVSLVRSVLAAEPGGAPAWHARLAAFVREGAFDVAVLARVWDPDTLAALRGALPPGARLVRLTEGVRAALDDRFDHVLDVAGLQRLLAGALVGADARVELRRTSPAELRRRAASGPPRLRVLAPEALPGEPEADASGRPTLSGPVPGCPFLLDAARNPVFAGALAGRSDVQTKGCSFCLDNIGAYATPTEEAVVEAWMAQLRAARARRPEIRELLLTDERPHPYLPAFFRALLAEPGMAPIELLFKSRVDWLLELADAVAEAARLAAEHGSVLHLYLVGFESFDQAQLDLFNKGVTVADNVAAIEKMRELGERFPRSFEYRRYRAHGVVLFTPWTNPESLLTNAAWMRRVRFHELRSEAVRTRLRLYPRVPLHALAERDGLLTEAFAPGRPDRAAEQGYDASVPWRFQHPAMEAVFRAANDLGRAYALTDADLIEVAARLVTRHPGLAAVPEVAWLPLREALRAWGPSGALRVEAALLGVDLEVEGILRGWKRACLKEGVPTADAEGLCRAYVAMGLFAEIVSLHGLDQGSDTHARGASHAIVAVAAEEAALAEVLAAQRAHAGGGPAVVEAMGALMGYPPCCVRAFLAQRTRGDNLENERLTFRRAPQEPLHPLVHRVGAVRLLSHHPCSPSCAGSVQLGQRLLAALEAVDAPAAARVREQLDRPVLFLDYQRRLELEGAWEGDAFRVDRATILDDPRHLPIDASALAAVTLGPAGARFTLRDGGRVEVAAPRPLLVTPGAPIAAPALAALGDDQAPCPPLPPQVRPGVRVHAYRITAVEARGAAREITLASPEHRFVVRARAHDPARPFTLRRGPFALDVDDPGALPDAARVALGILVRALPER